MRKAVLTVAVALAVLVGWRSTADDKPDAKKVIADRLSALEYPGSKRFKDDNLGTIAQVVLVTPDEFAKVDEWYRKALGINKALGTGVSGTPWPSGAKPSESRGQQQRAVFQDEMRPKGDDVKEVALRTPATRSYVSRTPERTAVVVVSRGPDDKQTMVSVTVLPEGGR
jgi:hypothetical protein